MIDFVMFLNCVCIGLITGLVCKLFSPIKMLFKNNWLIDVTIDFIVYLFGGLFIWACSNYIVNGAFFVYELLGFVLGVGFAKITYKNLFANFFHLLYNWFVKLFETFKKTRVMQKMLR